MAFMMPVVKNDWDIYNSGRSRRVSEASDKPGGRVRKVSESRSEGPALAARASALSPHRSAPAMRSLSYCRPRDPPRASASPPVPQDKLSSRARAASPRRGCAGCVPYL